MDAVALLQAAHRHPRFAGFSKRVCGACVNAAMVVASALSSGCASPAPPRDFDLHRAAIVRGSDNPDAARGGSSGAAAGAGRGALVGVGTGAIAGGALCLATGPWFPACLAVLIPASTAVGTASGAAIGAVKAESKEASAAKTAMLRQSAASVSYQQALTAHLQQQTQSRLSIVLALVEADGAATASGTPPPWLIKVGLDEISAASDVADQPFGIWVGAHVELRRPGTTAVVYKMDYGVTTEASLTTAQWSANDSQAVQSAIDRSLQQLAQMMLKGLLREPVAPPPKRTPASTADAV